MIKNKILHIPKLPPQIIAAVNDNRLAIFFGAGVSMLIGCSNWENLGGKLIDKCYSTPKIDNNNETCINYKEREALKQMNNPKKVITICHYILNKNNAENEFFKEIEESLKPKDELLVKNNIYNELKSLPALFITTNIDTHFDIKYLPPNIIIDQKDFNEQNIDNSKLYHIHGSIKDWSTVVLSIDEYFKRYNDKGFTTFLNRIFSEKVILFIGYGLNEYEVLDFLISKSGISPQERDAHYVLLPFYQGEDTLLEFEEHYFSQMGITVIPYRKDEKGYGQLFEVIKSWNKEILYHSRFLHESYETIKNSVQKYDENDENKIFQLIKTDKSLEFEFFRELSKTSNPSPWLEAVRNHGYFNPENNPSNNNEYGYHWYVLGFLENVAKRNNETPLDVITNSIIEIIHEISTYRDSNLNYVKNLSTDRYLISIIFLLPVNEINADHFEFVERCFQSYEDTLLFSSEFNDKIIPKLIENNQRDLLIRALEIILGYKQSKNQLIEQFQSVFREYYFEQLIKKYSKIIVKICGIQVVDIALRKIEEIVNQDESQFNEVWIPSIKKEGDIRDRYDVQIIHFIWVGLTTISQDIVKIKIKELLNKEHPIFKRLAIAVIDEYYDAYNILFWEWGSNPIDDYYLTPELYELFDNHCDEFSKENIKRIIDWVESANYHEERLTDDIAKQQKYLASCKKKWFLPLLSTKNPEIISLYEKYNAINPVKLTHPGRNFVIEPFSRIEGPISKDNLLEKTNSEIVEYLNSFNEKDDEFFRFSIHSLCEIVQTCIEDSPNKFISDLTPFLVLKREFQYSLLIGLLRAIKKEINVNWEKIFNFITSLVQSESFWSDEVNDGKNDYRNLVVSQIAILINEGLNNKSQNFDTKLLPEVENILLILVKNSKSDLYDMGDLVTSVLNSSKGNIYSGMLNYSISYAKIYKQNDEEKWIDSIKNEFDFRLNRENEPSLEFSFTLGEYFPSIYSLDKQWVIYNINRIFLKEDESHWIATMTGYLYYSRIYKDIYDLLKNNNHYSKALLTEFKDPHITEQLVQHISLAYFEGFENLTDDSSLFSQMLTIWNPRQILELVRIIRWQGSQITPEKREKILPLWKIILEKSLSNSESVENQNILAELNNWIIIIEELNKEVAEWLKKSVKYIKYDFIIMDNLIAHSIRTPRLAGEIFHSMIEEGQLFDYNKDEIIKLVTTLYDKNEKELADSICNRYLHQGFEFLIDIYEQNN